MAKRKTHRKSGSHPNRPKETDAIKLAKIAIIVILIAGLLFVLPLDEILEDLDSEEPEKIAKTMELSLYIVESYGQTELSLHLQ